MKKIIQQAFFQLRNQPLLSVITVLGTALAIALIMVILIVYQAKTADYAPEVNRSRSLYVKWERTVYDKKDPNSAGHSRPSLWLVKEIFYPLTTPEAVTATYEGGEVLVGTVGSDEEMNTPLMLTDAAFWKVYQFRFLAGKPFTEADFQSGMKQAVIAKSVARRLFGGAENAIGKDILVNFAAYTVCGVKYMLLIPQTLLPVKRRQVKPVVIMLLPFLPVLPMISMLFAMKWLAVWRR